MNEELNPGVQTAPDVLESPVVVEAEAEMPNYSEMSLAELSQLFEELAASEDRMKRSKEADAIKAAFYKRLSKERSATLGVEEGEAAVAEENGEPADETVVPDDVESGEQESGDSAPLNPFTALENGFKAVYADPANKPLLINLLNTVLPDDVRVSDIVEYRDREQTPDTIYSKKTVLDLVCKDVEGNIFGIEVQKKVDSRLFSRCVFYAAGQYHSQLLAGGDYASLHPVFEIAFLAENYPHENPGHWDADHIVSHYTFAEKRTGEIPNPTIFIILAEIGRFDKTEEECLTTRDRLFYWFRHANEFKEKPAWLDDPESEALLNATEIAAFTPEKKEIYDQDMKKEQDIEYEKSIC